MVNGKAITVVAMLEEKKLVNGDVYVMGVGGINVIKSLSSIDRNTPILNIGYAGSNILAKGTIVHVGKVSHYHPNIIYEEPSFELGGNVHCYTSDSFVTKTDIKEPCVFDMELAYILALGFKNVTAIKIVSDNLCESEFEETVLQNG